MPIATLIMIATVASVVFDVKKIGTKVRAPMTGNSIILLKILQGNPGWQPKANLARQYNTISVIYELSVNQQHAMLVLRNTQHRMVQLVPDWSPRCNNRFT